MVTVMRKVVAKGFGTEMAKEAIDGDNCNGGLNNI